MTYVFPGITPFVERAAKSHGLSDELRSRIGQSWHVKAVANALAQLPEQAANHPEAVPEVVDRLNAIRAGLSAQLEAVSLAITEVLNAVDPPRTVALKDEPKPKRNRRTKAAAEPAADEPQEPDDEREEDESAD